MVQRPLALVSLLVVAAAVPAACSSKKAPPPVTPVAAPDAGVDAAPSAWAAMGPASASAAPSGSVAPSASASTAPSAVPSVDMSAAADAAIDLAMQKVAKTAAPKMAPEGKPGRATLAEGQHFAMLVTLQPNRCYTVIAYSPPGSVSKVEAKLLAPPLFNIEAGKSGAADKNVAVIGKGKKALCPFLPLPIAYRVDVVAQKGAGRVGVQLYSRAK